MARDEAQGLALRWDAAPGAEGYAVYRGEGDGQALRPIAVLEAGTTGYVDREACAGVGYCYGIKALAGERASAMSNLLTAQKAPEPALNAVTLAVRDATALEVCWEGWDSEAGYAVYATVAGQARAVAGTGGVQASEYVLEGLAPGTAYTVYVQERGSGDYLAARAALAEAPSFRAYAYRWQQCRVVRQTLHNGKPRWEGASTIPQAELAGADALSAFGLQLKGTWEGSAEEKRLDLCVVLRTPGGDVFVQRSQVRYAGEETALATVFPLEGVLRDARAAGVGWTPGKYQCELYMNGGLAGRAAFAVP